MRTKTRVQMVLMYKAMDQLKQAREELHAARETMVAARVGGIINDLETELEKWEVIASSPAYGNK